MHIRTAELSEAASADYAARTARNREAFLDFVRLYYDEMKVREAFERYVHPDYIQHNPAVVDGREAAIAHLEGLLARPTVSMDVRRLLVDGDYAVAHLIGRQGPEDPGHALMNIFRMEDGIIVEHWDVAQPVPATTASGRGMG
ncbi:putative SnoaL-like aldol condensation-catalyzing enzyme [Altererythrobacter atlanticus]|uniref:SnoaL-like domain protein n=1 Tax=Croceibacterium atlanticum TaxID=1267766 RepID=A0A0F7KW60_9SPHN|nr:nuclear transport factor 2 family protein [Croceibacterium atlanticum]AKH43949.1 SnoaL-like domain protein [Croceibacterium atlanticum]MBB5733601.1 putative SnoaL-like aldol condensation-catalyzing enzyme [Croceibacterium atlanticum]